MFPSPTIDRPARRSLRELVRDALGSALEFATLGEATLSGTPSQPTAPPPSSGSHRPSDADASGTAGPGRFTPSRAAAVAPADGIHAGEALAPAREHPHRLALVRPSRPRRPGAVPARPPVCTAPVSHRSSAVR